jgi:histidine ammonia-lyase
LSLQGLQFVATSTTALSQSLAYPHHLHSISTNGDNQDVVSMGTDGALLAYKVLTNAFVVLSIEAVCLAQATDILSISPKLSKATKTFFKTIRAHVPPVMNDRPLSEEMNRLAEILKLS